MISPQLQHQRPSKIENSSLMSRRVRVVEINSRLWWFGGGPGRLDHQRLNRYVLFIYSIYRYTHTGPKADGFLREQREGRSRLNRIDLVPSLGTKSDLPARSLYLFWLLSIYRSSSPRPLTCTPSSCNTGRDRKSRYIIGKSKRAISRPWHSIDTRTLDVPHELAHLSSPCLPGTTESQRELRRERELLRDNNRKLRAVWPSLTPRRGNFHEDLSEDRLSLSLSPPSVCEIEERPCKTSVTETKRFPSIPCLENSKAKLLVYLVRTYCYAIIRKKISSLK